MKTPAFFKRSELTATLWTFRREFLMVGFFSMVANVLMLTPTLYMLQVYDRVMASQSELTLLAMSLPGADPVHKISIIPRGIGALGYTIQRPTEDRFLLAASDQRRRIDGLRDAVVASGEPGTATATARAWAHACSTNCCASPPT